MATQVTVQHLRAVGFCLVPAAVRRHRFVREALACAKVLSDPEKLDRIIGTENTRLPELYGWAPPIAKHTDNAGYMYLMPIIDGGGVLHAEGADPVPLELGTIIRLDDRRVHWVEGGEPSVAMFLGCYPEPVDTLAVQSLCRALFALERGDYYGAPRVKDGFRALLDDECYAALPSDERCRVMLTKDARAAGLDVQECAFCHKPAVQLDEYWPYYTEQHRCRDHLAESGRDLGGAGAIVNHE